MANLDCNGVETPNRLSDAGYLLPQSRLTLKHPGHISKRQSNIWLDSWRVCVSDCDPVININYTIECRPCAILPFFIKAHEQH